MKHFDAIVIRTRQKVVNPGRMTCFSMKSHSRRGISTVTVNPAGVGVCASRQDR